MAEKIYNDLMNLVKNDEAFFFKDFTFEGKIYRIFNYRLASWTSFMAPSAINARGIMYDVTNESSAQLVSMPPAKFFNYEEGGVDHTIGVFGDKMIKMDGSLISSYVHNGKLYLKSKGSLFSEQAVAAMKFLDKNVSFKQELTRLAQMDYTINMEYTSPENRIVIPYQEEGLTVLSVRSHTDGENFFATKLKSLLVKLGSFDEVINNMVDYQSLHTQSVNQNIFVNEVRQEQEGEGYVIEVVLNEKDSYLVKVKNLKYIALHQTKDSVNSPKKLFEAIIEEASDDLRAMFAGDDYVLNKIEEMESQVQPIFNHIVKTVEDFYAQNRHLERKDFAIKAQREAPEFMGLIMGLYSDKKINYKEFAKKHRKDMFNISDVEPEMDE